VKSSPKTSPEGEILMPGEIEERNRTRRKRDGIELDETTWGQIQATAQALSVAVDGASAKR
jgi:LDH2 family malate/lactate/ureidoglycolate dehydrogenase